MDRHQMNDITTLILGLPNGSPSVSQSIRRALRAMGNSDDDITRIIDLLRRRPEEFHSSSSSQEAPYFAVPNTADNSSSARGSGPNPSASSRQGALALPSNGLLQQEQQRQEEKGRTTRLLHDMIQTVISTGRAATMAQLERGRSAKRPLNLTAAAFQQRQLLAPCHHHQYEQKQDEFVDDDSGSSMVMRGDNGADHSDGAAMIGPTGLSSSGFYGGSTAERSQQSLLQNIGLPRYDQQQQQQQGRRMLRTAAVKKGALGSILVTAMGAASGSSSSSLPNECISGGRTTGRRILRDNKEWPQERPEGRHSEGGRAGVEGVDSPVIRRHQLYEGPDSEQDEGDRTSQAERRRGTRTTRSPEYDNEEEGDDTTRGFSSATAIQQSEIQEETRKRRNDPGMTEDRASLFPFILHDLLGDLEKACQTSIASWTADGNSFQIGREDVFAQRLLSLYFQLASMEEFKYTLETWGFQVLIQENGRYLYKHPDFVKHSPQLHSLTRMQRWPVNRATSTETAPHHPAFQQPTIGAVDSRMQVPPSATVKASKPMASVNETTDVILPCKKRAKRTELFLSDLGETRSGGDALHEESESTSEEYAAKQSKSAIQNAAGADEDIVSSNRVPHQSATFLKRLRDVLSKAEDDEELQNVIGWKSHGLTFKVYDRSIFVQRLLRDCMDSDNYEAFQRVLRRWGFIRIRRGHEEGAHFHMLFQRDKPSLVENLTPQQIRSAMQDDTLQSAWEKAKDASGSDRHGDIFGGFLSSTKSSRTRAQEEVIPKLPAHDIISEQKDQTAHAPVTGEKTRQAARIAADCNSGPSATTAVCGGYSAISGVKMAPTSSPLATRKVKEFRINHAHDLYYGSNLMFPWHLHQILDDAAEMGDVDDRAIGWNPDEASFSVYNTERLISDVLSNYFGDEVMSWSTFTTELSHWGFVQFTSGPQKGAFIHRLLVKGKPSLCKQMRYKGKTVAKLLKNQAAFLLRLHETLSLIKKCRRSPPAYWATDGKSFQVDDPAAFLSDVFSIYYDTLNLTVFEQKLRAWGFVKKPTDLTLGVSAQGLNYSHPMFVREEKPVVTRIESEMKGQSIAAEHSFLIRLRVLLDDAEHHGHKMVISWLPHGKSFAIFDRSYFSEKILPHYFKTKLTSFRQTLRSYGFAQMGGCGWDSGSYYHKLFVRDDPSLCQGLQQDEMKRAMPEWIPPQDEPNFYAKMVSMEEAISQHASLSTISVEDVQCFDGSAASATTRTADEGVAQRKEDANIEGPENEKRKPSSSR